MEDIAYYESNLLMKSKGKKVELRDTSEGIATKYNHRHGIAWSHPVCPFADNTLRCHVCNCQHLRYKSKHAGCIGTCHAFTCPHSPATNAVLPVNHCIQSTPSTASKKRSKLFLQFHHFLGQPLLLRCHGCSELLPRLQDLGGVMTKRLQSLHLERKGGLTES